MENSSEELFTEAMEIHVKLGSRVMMIISELQGMVRELEREQDILYAIQSKFEL